MEIVRESAAICDMSTLGKILIQGPDAAEFLSRVYVNNWQSLAIGKSRLRLQQHLPQVHLGV